MQRVIKKVILVIVAIVPFMTTMAQDRSVPVFVAGTEGHNSYRIPAIISLPTGELLAFCEGRVNGSGDFGDINIVMKRSTDRGQTWGGLRIVAEFDTLQAGNPGPVVDMTDPLYPRGRVFLFYNTGNDHEGEVRKGKGFKQVWYKTSSDEGQTWSDATDITTQVHRPFQPQVKPAYSFSEDWRTYAITPGHAMQFLAGTYKERIFVAANHSAGPPQKQDTDYDAHGFYTDDHGKTFHLGKSIGVPGSNESTAVELSNSKLMMNSRNQRGDIRARIVSTSSDGGATWDTSWFDNNLPDPVCQGSILGLGKKKGKYILAFCNAADPGRRNNLTLRISFDEGKTWQKNFLIYKSDQPGDNAAYSDIVNISKNEIGILYEKDHYSGIIFTTVKWK